MTMKRKVLACMVSVVFLILAGTVFGAEVCDDFQAKYQTCMKRKAAGGNMDYDVCRGEHNQGDCIAEGCYWNTTTGRCIIDICLADSNFDEYVDGDDLGILKKDYGRSDGCVIDPIIPGYLGAQVPKTGQTTCYDTSGNSRDCAGTGEDGEYQKGIASPNPRFTDHGDGTVTDNLTGLMWTKDAQQIPGTMSWQAALDACNNLVYPVSGGYDDWRLPNLREQHSLIDYGQINPALPVGHPFTNALWYVWTSTTSVRSPDKAWVVALTQAFGGSEDGHVVAGQKTQTSFIFLVWAVRGGL